MERLNNLSKEGKKVLENQYGYRDEYLFGEMVVDFEKVLYHETEELGNTDIFDTLENLYDFKLPHSTDTLDTLEDSLWQKYLYENNEAVIAFIRKALCTSGYLYCKWVCAEKDDVCSTYGAEEDNVTKFSFDREKSIIVSDCATDGVLIVSRVLIKESEGEK